MYWLSTISESWLAINMHTIFARITSDEQSKQAYEVLQIPKQFHPFINGPNSDRVKKWMSEYSNVRINIPPPGVMKDELSVAGEREGVLKVVEQIKKFHQDLVRFENPVITLPGHRVEATNQLWL